MKFYYDKIKKRIVFLALLFAKLGQIDLLFLAHDTMCKTSKGCVNSNTKRSV